MLLFSNLWKLEYYLVKFWYVGTIEEARQMFLLVYEAFQYPNQPINSPWLLFTNEFYLWKYVAKEQNIMLV